MQITRAYLSAFGATLAEQVATEWSPERHLEGLKAVFRAGADAGRRQALAATGEADNRG